MSRECTDGRFEKLLYAYELGLLDDDDRRRLEIHILECEHCFERTLNFEQAADLICNDSDIRKSVLTDFADSGIPREGEQSSRLSKRSSWQPARLAWIGAAAIAIVALLIINPWEIRIEPRQPAVAASNRIAVMYFEDLTGSDSDDRLGEVAANLLITDLSESEYLDVVSDQRLYDALKYLGLSDLRSISRATAADIAEVTSAEWILLGSVLQREPTIELTAQLIDARKGDVEASRRVSGQVGEDIFDLIDRLSVQVKRDLSLPDSAFLEDDRPVSDMTTNNEEAYKLFLEAVELRTKLYDDEARDRFEQVIRHDSTYAMAYYFLSQLTTGATRTDMIESAVRFSDRSSTRDSLYIASMAAVISGDTSSAVATLENLVTKFSDEKEAYVHLSIHEGRRSHVRKAIMYLNKALDIDPVDKISYNLLAYQYHNLGDDEGAMWALNRYVEAAPNEANPYDSRGELYLRRGEVDSAKASFERAIQIKPDFYPSLAVLSRIYIIRGDHAKARECFGRLMESTTSSFRLIGELGEAGILISRGRLNESLALLDQIIGSGLADTDPEIRLLVRTYAHYMKAGTLAEMNNLDAAAEELAICRETATTLSASHGNLVAEEHIRMLAESGDLARAEQEAEKLKASLTDSNEALHSYWYAQASIDRAKGNFDAAARLFARASQDWSYRHRYMQAVSYIENRQYRSAIDLLKALLGSERYTLGLYVAKDVKLHYHLGIAYESVEMYEEASEQYRTFIDYWKDADTVIESIEDAKRRLERIAASS